MGNHRAERRGPRRRPSETRTDPSYVGRRVARPEPAAPEVAPSAPVAPSTGTHYFGDLDHTAELPLVRAQTPGKRRAVKHAGSRGPLFKGLPSPPVLLGAATVAVAVVGVVTAPGDGAAPQPAYAAGSVTNNVRPASALNGSAGIATVGDVRAGVSRASDRQTLQQATGEDLVEMAEAQAAERNTALSTMQAEAQKFADQLLEDQWYLPLNPSIITATFGEYGLWSSYHTGLDFNGENGDPIYSIATGVVTFVGYDGAYGNKTVVTLEDGTELWYCHQTSQYVSVGDTVAGNEVIGTVGSTGNVTGSHLHVEVRPGGGDPVDPYTAFQVHGVTP
jgi:murein DD-endopeptidase MepM/ murein hydrolase activator NlpD